MVATFPVLKAFYCSDGSSFSRSLVLEGLILKFVSFLYYQLLCICLLIYSFVYVHRLAMYTIMELFLLFPKTVFCHSSLLKFLYEIVYGVVALVIKVFLRGKSLIFVGPIDATTSLSHRLSC